MKVIVAGGRNFNDYALMKERLDHYFQNLNKDELVIISGKASGADSLGERYAKENGIKIEGYPANWKRYGNAAGPIRNKQMIVEGKADALVAFWDNTSRGTGGMIKLAEEHGLHVRVVRY